MRGNITALDILILKVEAHIYIKNIIWEFWEMLRNIKSELSFGIERAIAIN